MLNPTQGPAAASRLLFVFVESWAPQLLSPCVFQVLSTSVSTGGLTVMVHLFPGWCAIARLKVIFHICFQLGDDFRYSILWEKQWSSVIKKKKKSLLKSPISTWHCIKAAAPWCMASIVLCCSQFGSCKGSKGKQRYTFKMGLFFFLWSEFTSYMTWKRFLSVTFISEGFHTIHTKKNTELHDCQG